MNVDILWSKLLNQIKDELTSLSYSTWFADTELYKLQDGKAYIIVPMPIHKKHLMDNYADLIISKLFEITDSHYELILLLKEEVELEEKKEVEKREKVLEKNNAPNNNVNKEPVPK